MTTEINQLFEHLKTDIVNALSQPITEDISKEFQRHFATFTTNLEDVYLDVFSDPEQEQKLLSENPGIEAYWSLIKNIHANDLNIYKAITADKNQTIQNMADVLNSAETLDFINRDCQLLPLTQLPGEKELINKTTASVKMERIAQYFAFALTGKPSELIQTIQQKDPDAEPSFIYSQLKQSFNKNVHFLNVNKNYVRFYTPKDDKIGRNLTDGVTFEELADGNVRCFVVFATAKASTFGQGKQLFRHTEYIERGAKREKDSIIGRISEITPVLVCKPLATSNQKVNPFEELFSNDINNKETVDLLNSIPLFTQLGNISTRTPETINKLINTIYFTVGENTINTHNQLQILKQISSPEREKAFLKIVATKVANLSETLATKAKNDPKQYLNNKELTDLCQDSLFGIAQTINGMVKHSAFYREDTQFIEDMSNILQQTNGNYRQFISKINQEYNGDGPSFQAFLDAVKKTRSSTFREEVEDVILQAPTAIEENDFFEKVNPSVQSYVDNHISPLLSNKHSWGDCFEEIVQAKADHGDSCRFTSSDGISARTYSNFNKFTNTKSVNYNQQFPLLNERISELFNILKNNRTSNEIMAAIEHASLSLSTSPPQFPQQQKLSF